MKKASAVALLAAASIWAGQADYFPLQVGNQWVLQSASSTRELLNVEVLRSRTRNGQTYFLVAGYAPEQRWVRERSDGALVALDESSGAEQILTQPFASFGGYRTSLGGCEQFGQPFAGAGPYRGANFDFEQSLRIAYLPGSCRDIGILNEAYAPGVGLVQRSITTIRGEIAFDLVYARVNGSPLLGKSKEIVLPYDFTHGSGGWLAGFTDYDLRMTDLRRLAEVRALPDEIDASRSGFYLQGMNRSDDLFMFLKKQVSAEDGVQSDQAYLVSFDIRMSSNAPSGCAGAGGAPGESVFLKAGASADEPLALLTGTGEVRLSVDKGQQAAGGTDAGVAGTIANGTACAGAPYPYVSVTREYAHPRPIRTDSRASLWLLTGTDSGYEGLTGLYFESITVRINPAAGPAGPAGTP